MISRGGEARAKIHDSVGYDVSQRPSDVHLLIAARFARAYICLDSSSGDRTPLVIHERAANPLPPPPAPSPLPRMGLLMSNAARGHPDRVANH